MAMVKYLRTSQCAKQSGGSAVNLVQISEPEPKERLFSSDIGRILSGAKALENSKKFLAINHWMIAKGIRTLALFIPTFLKPNIK